MTSSLIRGRLAAELPVMVRVAERLQVASPAAARAALKRIARASPSSTIIISSCPSSSFPRAIALSCEKQVQNTVLHRQSRVPRGSSSSSPTSSSPRASSSSSPRPAGHRRRRSQPFRLQCARAGADHRPAPTTAAWPRVRVPCRRGGPPTAAAKPLPLASGPVPGSRSRPPSKRFFREPLPLARAETMLGSTWFWRAIGSRGGTGSPSVAPP